MEKNKKNRREVISDVLILTGGAAVSVGVSLLHIAAGVIVGGMLAMVFGWLIGRAGDV